jgi:hypothetical protein
MNNEAERFLGLPEDNRTHIDQSPELTTRKRALILVATWSVALFATSPDPRGISLLPFFPVGMQILFYKHPESNMNQFMIIGWATYLLYGIITLTAQTKKLFYRLLAFLVIILMFNVAGCRILLSSLPKAQ